MILVGRYRSPFTRRVAVSMRMLGLAYEHRPRTALTQFEEVKALNPVARVPILILDSGEVLFDSTAILDHLDQTVGPERALVPSKPEARRAVWRAVALALGVTEKVVAVVYERRFHPPEKVHQPWIDRCEEQARSGLAALDATTNAPFEGTPLNQAGVTAGVMYDFVKLVNPALLPAGRYKRLDEHFARCARLPAFIETAQEPD
jgi:glutathione S-transferase